MRIQWKNVKVKNKDVTSSDLLTSSTLVGEYYASLPLELKNVVEFSASQIAILEFFSTLEELGGALDEVLATRQKPTTLFRFKNGKTYYSSFER
jgi:hypothetical protein